MTFNEWLDKANTHYLSQHTQRRGQLFFNSLYVFRPDIANQLRATVLDPFYADEVIPDFLAKVEELWDRD